MANYPLAPMLRVRYLHEEQAKRDVQTAERHLQKTQDQLQQAKDALKEYQIWRPSEEERRYAQILGQQISQEKLAKFREELGQLAQEELRLQGVVHEAEKTGNQAQEQVEKARKEVILARRACLKLEEHRDIWQAAQNREQERLSDLEMEEARSPTFESDES